MVWNIFSHILRRILPTDELIFFRGVGIPPTIYSSANQDETLEIANWNWHDMIGFLPCEFAGVYSPGCVGGGIAGRGEPLQRLQWLPYRSVGGRLLSLRNWLLGYAANAWKLQMDTNGGMFLTWIGCWVSNPWRYPQIWINLDPSHGWPWLSGLKPMVTWGSTIFKNPPILLCDVLFTKGYLSIPCFHLPCWMVT